MAAVFSLPNYLGVWYELAHYPSWFQRNDNYNTMAVYSMNADGSIKVHNSTIANGKRFDSYGTARVIRGTNLRVDFPMPEVKNLVNSGQFKPFQGELDRSMPNYVVDKIWTNHLGEYICAIVTDPSRQSFYLLCRYPNPSLQLYNDVMAYVIANFDRDRLVQTPHFQ